MTEAYHHLVNDLVPHADKDKGRLSQMELGSS